MKSGIKIKMPGYKINLATVISKYYLGRIFCLLHSLKNFSNTKIHILCFDKESYSTLRSKKIKNIVIYNKEELYKFDNNLKDINESRELINQIVTSRPVFIKYLFKKNIKSAFLIDADIFFFDNPKKLLNFHKKSSISFAKHNFTFNADINESLYGKYNAGYLFFRSDTPGNKFLNDWISLCKNWCLFKPEKNKFSDQKYLESLFKKYKKDISIISHPGVNLAPWNMKNVEFKRKKKLIFANNENLIFFHFHGIKKLTQNIFTLGTSNYNFILKNISKKIIYDEYIKLLKKYSNEKFKYWKIENNINFNYFNIIKLIKYIMILTKKFLYNDFKITL
jgi:hypothetical protein